MPQLDLAMSQLSTAMRHVTGTLELTPNSASTSSAGSPRASLHESSTKRDSSVCHGDREVREEQEQEAMMRNSRESPTSN
ncbi:unnamed protein product [Lampetra planeri]